MSQTFPTRDLTLRYQGLFDFEGLYQLLVGFFRSRHYDYVEKLWKEKDATPAGREITIKMAPEKKVNEYIKYHYSVEWKSIDAHDVEVVRDGKKLTLTHARFHIILSAKVEYDWQDLAKESKKLAPLAFEFAIKDEIYGKYLYELQLENQQLLDEIKAYLNMEIARQEKAHG